MPFLQMRPAVWYNFEYFENTYIQSLAQHVWNINRHDVLLQKQFPNSFVKIFWISYTLHVNLSQQKIISKFRLHLTGFFLSIVRAKNLTIRLCHPARRHGRVLLLSDAGACVGPWRFRGQLRVGGRIPGRAQVGFCRVWSQGTIWNRATGVTEEDAQTAGCPWQHSRRILLASGTVWWGRQTVLQRGSHSPRVGFDCGPLC